MTLIIYHLDSTKWYRYIVTLENFRPFLDYMQARCSSFLVMCSKSPEFSA